MSIRTKILFVILLATIPPILFLRVTGMRSMDTLSREVEMRTSSILLHDTSKSLQRIVLDHARLLKRERQLIDAALAKLADNATFILKQNAQKPAATPPSPSEKSSQHSETDNGHGFCVHATSEKDKDLLLQLTSKMQRIAQKYSDIILWQQVYLNDGSQLFFPTSSGMHAHDKCLFGALVSPHSSSSASWTQPMIDPIFDTSIFTASQAITSPDGQVAGSVTIAVPVNVLLRDPGHLTAISEHVRAYIVQATDKALTVLASRDEEQNNGKWHTEQDQEMPIDSEAAMMISQDILQDKMGARSGMIDDEQYVFSYAPLGLRRAALLIAIPQEDVVKGAVEEAAELRQIFTAQMDRSHTILFVTLLGIGLLAIFLSSSLSKNIYKLVQAVRKISSGNLETRVADLGHDEIGELGQAINEMVPALKENVHFRDSLELASAVQKKLQPRQMPEVPGYDIAGASYYCAETGGDYFDFLTCPTDNHHRLLMALGDVVGHGVSAALLMSTARAYLRSCAQLEPNLSIITAKANNLVVCDTYGTGQFMTLFFAALDTLSGRFSWTRAGHDSGFIYRNASSAFEELKGKGATALGVIPDAEYVENSITVASGDLIVIASDGIWETRGADGSMFGKERMKEVLENLRTESAEELIVSLYTAVIDFAENKALEDDFTCIIVKRL